MAAWSSRSAGPGAFVPTLPLARRPRRRRRSDGIPSAQIARHSRRRSRSLVIAPPIAAAGTQIDLGVRLPSRLPSRRSRSGGRSPSSPGSTGLLQQHQGVQRVTVLGQGIPGRNRSRPGRRSAEKSRRSRCITWPFMVELVLVPAAPAGTSMTTLHAPSLLRSSAVSASGGLGRDRLADPAASCSDPVRRDPRPQPGQQPGRRLPRWSRRHPLGAADRAGSNQSSRGWVCSSCRAQPAR